MQPTPPLSTHAGAALIHFAGSSAKALAAALPVESPERDRLLFLAHAAWALAQGRRLHPEIAEVLADTPVNSHPDGTFLARVAGICDRLLEGLREQDQHLVGETAVSALDTLLLWGYEPAILASWKAHALSQAVTATTAVHSDPTG